jgi:tetratricopeptide (TPR) repeat protein
VAWPAVASETTADTPHFSLSPTALADAAAASHAPQGADVDLLEVQETYEFAADGSDRYTQYLLYRILTPAGAQSWKALSIEWAPWRGSKPAMKARVVRTDGTAYMLDQSTIADSPTLNGDAALYSDMRVLHAPLPAIAPGAVVESEIVLTEKPVFNGSGKVGRAYFQMNQPIEHVRLVLQAPQSLSLRYRTDLLPGLTPKITRADGRIRWVFDSGPTPAAEPSEAGLPGDVYAAPIVTFASGVSWQEVAQAYSQIVAARVADARVGELTARLIGGRATREAKASAMVEYLNNEIRYTGIEFGQASVIPHSTAETLAHRYGDCKDKSLLLVAMLSAAGIPAKLALLNAGDQLDVPDDLPGMGLFNHAIVMVPGEPVLWIDATEENARLGELPDADRGRAALIIDPDTTGLTRIDEAQSTDNVIYEEREIRLADNGPAYAVEISRPRGTFESDYRHVYADLDNKVTRENLTDYVKSEYLAERLEKLSRSDPRDFSQPFRLTLAGARAGRGQTDVSEAVAYIRIEGLFNQLPRELRTREPTEEENAKATRPARKRVADYLLSRPSVTEWRYRIVPPTGFVPAALPADVELALGPARLTEQFAAAADGMVQAQLRFDTVRRRFTPAEQHALREKVAELLEGQPVKIKFDLEAHRLLTQGHARESFAAYRAAIDQHPGDAVWRLRHADALLEAGLGEAARNEARLAVTLAPKSAFAEERLATTLQSDLIGRWHGAGADYEGAAAAYRAAVALDGANKSLVGNLAILLEYDAHGVRYGSGADLKAALATYGRLSAPQLAELGIAVNPPVAMFYAGDFAHALESARVLEAPPPALIVACEAVLHGAPAAIAEARRQTDGDAKYKETLTLAGQMLMNVREYPAAASLLEGGATGSNTARTMSLVALLRQTRRHEELKFGDDPEGFMRGMLVTTLSGPLTLESFAPFESRNARLESANLTPEEREQRVRAFGDPQTTAARTDVALDVLLDLIQPAMRIKSEGDDAKGYRVLMHVPNMHDKSLFIVREDGQLKLLDSSDRPVALAVEALERARRGDLAAASALLNWVREGRASTSGEDPYAADPFVRLWPSSDNHGSEGAITAAAAALLVNAPHSAHQGVELLERVRAAGSGAGADGIELALLEGYEQLHDHERALAIARDLAMRTPNSRRAFHAEATHLRALKRFAEADELAQQRLRAHPDDIFALHALVHNLAAQHQYEAAYRQALKVAANAEARAVDFNELAWLSLYFERDGGPDIDSALRAAQEQQSSSSILHTLGCLYAEVGKTREAREVLLQSMDASNLAQPSSDYWYGFGRIAEQFGEREVALADYAKVTPPKDPALEYFSTYRLAQIRIQALQRTKAAR